MKLVIASLVAVFASLIFHLPFLEATQCTKDAYCFDNHSGGRQGEAKHVNCTGNCAGWGCVVDGAVYRYYGCKEDDNICANKEKTDSKDYYFYVTCNDGYDCTSDKFNEALTEARKTDAYQFVTETSLCGDALRPTKDSDGSPGSITTTTNGTNETKYGAFKLVGMILFGWIFARFW